MVPSKEPANRIDPHSRFHLRLSERSRDLVSACSNNPTQMVFPVRQEIRTPRADRADIRAVDMNADRDAILESIADGMSVAPV
jgi:hypothetical protein